MPGFLYKKIFLVGRLPLQNRGKICRKVFQLFTVNRFFPEGKFLVTKFEFGKSIGMSLEGDCHKVEVTPNLE